tara:strand:- start:314 stop:496 length:183 start_codon:yes stop_codon:yes gene_type:complete
MTSLTLTSTDGITKSPDAPLADVGYVWLLTMYLGGYHHNHNSGRLSPDPHSIQLERPSFF